MTTTVFNNGNWRVSNGGLTAMSPNNNTKGAINAEYASTAIPDHAKTYFEFKVSGAALLTAFSVGFGEHGSNIGNIDVTPDGTTPKSGTYDYITYNRTITNSGFVVSDPQGNANFSKTHPGAIASPNTWENGAVIGVEVDRVNNQVTFLIDGRSQGTFSIANLKGESLYPLVSSWFKAGPVATIIGNPNDTPSGYTNLDDTTGSHSPGTPPPPPPPPPSGSHAPPPPPPPSPPVTHGNDHITVNQPVSLAVGQDTITGKETDPSQPVYLDWRTNGTPQMGDNDVIKATVAADGSFSATVPVDHPETSSTLWAGTGGAFSAQWSAKPSMSFLPPPPPPPSGVGNGIAVNQPSTVALGATQFTGHTDNPLQAVFMDWHTFGTPALSDSDWVQAAVDKTTGNFTATVPVDHAGMSSSVFVRGADNAVHQLWSATPA